MGSRTGPRFFLGEDLYLDIGRAHAQISPFEMVYRAGSVAVAVQVFHSNRKFLAEIYNLCMYPSSCTVAVAYKLFPSPSLFEVTV